MLTAVSACSDDGKYHVDGERAYYEEYPVSHFFKWGSGTVEINLAPGDSLKVYPLDTDYAMDSSNVYFQGKKLLDARPEEVEFLSSNGLGTYAVSNKYAFYKGAVVWGADPSTFQPLSDMAYAKDKAKVFYLGTVISGADSASFIRLSDSWAKDRWNVYYHGKRHSVKDVRTFGLISTDFSSDKYAIYHRGQIVSGVDPMSFEKVGYVDGNLVIRDSARCYQLLRPGEHTEVWVKVDERTPKAKAACK